MIQVISVCFSHNQNYPNDCHKRHTCQSYFNQMSFTQCHVVSDTVWHILTFEKHWKAWLSQVPGDPSKDMWTGRRPTVLSDPCCQPRFEYSEYSTCSTPRRARRAHETCKVCVALSLARDRRPRRMHRKKAACIRWSTNFQPVGRFDSFNPKITIKKNGKDRKIWKNIKDIWRNIVHRCGLSVVSHHSIMICPCESVWPPHPNIPQHINIDNIVESGQVPE